MKYLSLMLFVIAIFSVSCVSQGETEANQQDSSAVTAEQWIMMAYGEWEPQLIQSYLNQAIEVDPQNPVSRYMLALNYKHEEQPEKALSILNEGLRDTESAMLYHLRGVIRLWYLNDPQGAQDLTKAYELFPDSLKLALDNGRANELGEEYYLELEELFGPSWEIHVQLSDIYLWTKGVDEALLAMERAVQIDGHPPYLLFKLGELQELSGLFEEAKQNISNYAILEPNDPVSHVAMGRILLTQGEFQSAIYYLELSLEADWIAPEAYSLLVSAYSRLGDFSMANHYLETIEYPQEAFYRGIIIARQGRLYEAISAVEEALQMDPWNSNYLVSLTSLYIMTDQEERAQNLLSQMDPQDLRNNPWYRGFELEPELDNYGVPEWLRSYLP